MNLDPFRRPKQDPEILEIKRARRKLEKSGKENVQSHFEIVVVKSHGSARESFVVSASDSTLASPLPTLDNLKKKEV